MDLSRSEFGTRSIVYIGLAGRRFFVFFDVFSKEVALLDHGTRNYIQWMWHICFFCFLFSLGSCFAAQIREWDMHWA
jgi:hypothetical protein